MIMETCCKRFLFASQMIFKNLDDRSLANSKKINREIAKFLENERFYSIRIIKSYTRRFEGFEDSWKEVIGKCPSNILKQLEVACRNFFKTRPR